MTDSERSELFKMLVLDNMKTDPFGGSSLPIKCLQAYHDAVGGGEGELSYATFQMPNYEECSYSYRVGSDTFDWLEAFSIDSISYYDVRTGACAPLIPNDVLFNSVAESLFSGEACLSGCLAIDNLGRVYLSGMAEDNIYADYCLRLREGSPGISYGALDNSVLSRIWIEDGVFHLARVLLFLFSPSPT